MKFLLPLWSSISLTLLAVAGEPDFEPKVLKESKKSKKSKKSNSGDWCKWLGDSPGRFYRNKDNPWIQSVRIGGRVNYQFAVVDGNDVNGLDFLDSYDDFRRLRVETQTKFLRFFTAEVNLNLVDDTRFRRNRRGSVNFGDGQFDTIAVQFDIEKAFDLDFIDGLKLKAGRMRVRVTEEGHTSSRVIHTIERSSLEGIFAGDASRPTGLLLEVEKGDWELTVGAFNADDNEKVLNDFSEGVFYYGSLQWRPSKNFKMILDYLHNDRSNSLATSGLSDALGFRYGGSLSAVYKRKRWGANLTLAYGDNGGEQFEPDPRRQGDFYGLVFTPWCWLVKDRLELVGQYQFLGAEESQGIQVRSRYLRAENDNPNVDDDNGRGNFYHSFYAGLNFYPCKENMRVMLGVTYDNLSTQRGGTLDAVTYSVAFQTFF